MLHSFRNILATQWRNKIGLAHYNVMVFYPLEPGTKNGIFLRAIDVFLSVEYDTV